MSSSGKNPQTDDGASLPGALPGVAAPGSSVTPVRVATDLVLSAARRLVSQSSNDIEAAAKRLVASAPGHGIDLSLLWATVEGAAPLAQVRQACLAVPGAGRTAMLFVSEPPAEGDAATALEERVGLIQAACGHLAATMLSRVQIAQALPDPAEPWFVEALTAAAFTRVGNLSYLRRGGGSLPRALRHGTPPDDVRLVRVSDLPKSGVDALLVEAMDRSYMDTLDCPELCGLRETRDILASHRDTGRYDPSSWWLVFEGDEPQGCALFSPCPDAATAELVYLGLSPSVRGRGLGKHLLALGIEEVRRRHPTWPMTLAVDQRNTPALGLYKAFGFRSFGERVAYVRPLQELVA